MTNDTKSNLKPHHGTHNHRQAGKRGFLLSLVTCQQGNAKTIASDDNSGYYIDLSKNVSGHASRNPLAFFVPDNSVDSQTHSNNSSTAPKAHLSASRANTLIFMAASQSLLTNYDGTTLQNKIAARRICRAVTNVTESESRHPILIKYSVASTQKTLGVIHHG